MKKLYTIITYALFAQLCTAYAQEVSIQIEPLYTQQDLLTASRTGNADLVEEILKQGTVDINGTDEYGMSALRYAVKPQGFWKPKQEQFERVIELLVEHGADVNQSNGRRTILNNALHTYGRDSKVVQLLREKGALMREAKPKKIFNAKRELLGSSE